MIELQKVVVAYDDHVILDQCCGLNAFTTAKHWSLAIVAPAKVQFCD